MNENDDIPLPGTPYKPIWTRPGNTLVDKWTEPFTSGPCRGIVTMIRFKNKKGKLVEVIGFVKWVDEP